MKLTDPRIISLLATLLTTLVLMALVVRSYIVNRKSKIVEFANVGEGTRETGHASLLYDTNASPVTGTRYLLVKTSTDTDHITTCGAGDVPLGIANDSFDASNTDVPLQVAILGAAPGTQRVVTDGTIASGNYIKTGANGQATVATTGVAGIFGVAFFGTDTTSAAGDVITFIPVLPSKLAF